MTSRLLIAFIAAALVACAGPDEVEKPPAPTPGQTPVQAVDTPAAPPAEGEAPTAKTVLPPVPAETAPSASARLDAPEAKTLLDKTQSWFSSRVGRRIHVMTDKPLYRPGETVWIKSWDLRARDFIGELNAGEIRYQLVSPKGAVVLRKRVRQAGGVATNDFAIPAGVPGGEYTIKAVGVGGHTGERKVIVSAYEPPRVKKKLEFVRKAYGPGDTVSATIEVKRPTGEPLANQPLRAQVRLDGQMLPEVRLTTNADGGGLVKFTLPEAIEKGDALLTVLVDDGGVTESVSKRVPIVLDKIELSFFPEGGQMVEGLTGRVYFEAKNPIGKPADIEGKIVDDQGNAVARFASYHQGLGRFEFTPSPKRTYHAEITRPVGISGRYALPLAAETGCALRSFDDLDGQADALRVAVRCSEKQTVRVIGVLRENVLDAAAVEAGPEPAIVHLKGDDGLMKARGVARVTVFDANNQPLAERIVFRNRRGGLKVELTPDQETYVPREQVALKVRTTDAAGEPVSAELALAVVDDTVVSFADDKKGHLLSKMLLEPEVPGEVEEPNFYFDPKEKKSALAMDLLMGARGWRKFEWRPVFAAPKPISDTTGSGRGFGGGVPKGAAMFAEKAAEGKLDDFKDGKPGAARPAPRPLRAPPPRPVVAAQDPAPPAEPMAEAEPAPEPAAKLMAQPARVRAAEPMPAGAMMAMGDVADDEDQIREVAAGAEMPNDRDWAGAEQKAKKKIALGRRGRRMPVAWAKVRVFPAPKYEPGYEGPRTDFRDTIHWAPAVKTGADGETTVTFHVSDAITSFRIFAEGAGAGALGRAEKVFNSKLPFSLNVKLPLEVSAGDTLELPLTLTNEQDGELPVSLAASFGDLLKLEKPVALPKPSLAAKARESLYYPVTVTGQNGESEVRFSANAGGLSDEFTRTVRVRPLGFPQEQALSGTLSDQVSHTFDLGDATPGTVEASLKLYPSPVATMTGGLAGLIRQPSGCFEQTSSSNYPNVMVLKYLQANDVADPTLVARTKGLLDKGYSRLTSYETKDKGYEWFGHSPPHEALTAYGVLQFEDMKKVHDVDDAMVKRTVSWLKKRRDGKGGFQRNSKALDSFGRANDEVTNAYITYAVAEAGLAGDFEPEIAAQAKRAAATKDAYLLALAAGSLQNVEARAGEAKSAVQRLAEMQSDAGAWTQADHSITRSGGQNLHIETTALALLALMEAGGHDDAVRKGVEWLNKNRSGYGNYGSTQATVLALKALTEYSTRSRQTQSDGRVLVMVNGKQVASQDYRAGRREPLEFKGLGQHFASGANRVEVLHEGESKLPLSFAVSYRSVKPATHPDVAVELSTKLASDTVKMGENVRLTATVKNRTDKGQPMTLARVGLPGGLTFQNWQLKELVDKKLIAFFETKEREVILYFRDLKPSETKEIPLDLVATVPGTYTGPASSTYLYYTDDQKFWTDGLKATVTR